MKILGIETCTRVGSLAMVQDYSVLGEVRISENLRHAGAFETSLRALTRQTGLNEADMDAIAVSLGPGSFTGIRVGLSIAKALGLVLQKKIIGVGTLDALAHQISVSHSSLCPIIPSEGLEIYGAIYRRMSSHLTRVGDFFNVPIDQLIDLIDEKAYVFGPGVDRHASFLSKSIGESRLGRSELFPSASMIAIMAQNKKWIQAKVEPIYVKVPLVKGYGK